MNGTMYFVIDEEGGGGGGITDYNDLTNLPQINGVTLQSNRTAEDLHLLDDRSSLDPEQLDSLLALI